MSAWLASHGQVDKDIGNAISCMFINDEVLKQSFCITAKRKISVSEEQMSDVKGLYEYHR